VLHQPSTSRRLKLGIFFSHPTQHQSVMFQQLSQIAGLDVQVYYCDPGALGKMFDPGYGNSVAWDVDLLSGTRSVILPNWLRGREISVFRQFNPAVVGIMRRERFDALFLSGYISPTNWLVHSLAGSAHLLYFSDANIFDEQRKSQPWLKRLMRYRFLKRVNTFLLIGDKNREAYLSIGCDPQRMIWCPYPVDVRRYQAARTAPDLPQKLADLRVRYQIPAGAKVVAQCGKLISRKRPQDLIAAIRQLNRPDVYGLLIGSGPLEAEIRQSLTTQDQVRVTGFINQRDIPNHLLLADVGVVASEWDPHPLVTTEFAACGKPIVVSHFCGVWGEHDVLRPDENGLVYTCGQIDMLVQHLDQLIADKELRMRMGQRSLQIAAQQSAEYGAQIIVKHLLQTIH
jgi:glycosyltransferase involved in cell wall biosynthesis